MIFGQICRHLPGVSFFNINLTITFPQEWDFVLSEEKDEKSRNGEDAEI